MDLLTWHAAPDIGEYSLSMIASGIFCVESAYLLPMWLHGYDFPTRCDVNFVL